MPNEKAITECREAVRLWRKRARMDSNATERFKALVAAANWEIASYAYGDNRSA